jgi:GT2 family glycosyltransferase
LARSESRPVAEATSITQTSAPPVARGAISAVIVCYDTAPQEIREVVDGLRAQRRAPREIVIVDNDPAGALAAQLRGYASEVKTIVPGSNLGYGGGVNAAAREASGEYLLCLNPDAQVEAECVARLAAVADSDPQIALVGAQILLADGARRNAGANPLHPTGISPSGGYGEPRESGEPRDVAVVSGACCLIRRAALEQLDGFCADLFLYYEDVDLAWRARIAGMRVLYCPDAAVRHGYEFARRGRKWFYLERNRLFAVLANYERKTLMVLAPLLLLTELGLLAVAAWQRWLGQKLRSYGSLLALSRRVRAQRRAVRSSRRRTDAELLELFDDRIGSALMPARAAALANAVCLPYMYVVRRLLHAPARADAGPVEEPTRPR